MKSRFAIPVATLVLLALAPAAQANRRFPAAIRAWLQPQTSNTIYDPQCSLCHIENKTGPGTAITPFAYSMLSRGMDGSSTQKLDAALKKLQADRVDSDGDGVSDIDELLAQTDPNVYGAVSTAGRLDPQYGCGSVPGAALDALLLALPVGAMLMRRRRR